MKTKFIYKQIKKRVQFKHLIKPPKSQPNGCITSYLQSHSSFLASFSFVAERFLLRPKRKPLGLVKDEEKRRLIRWVLETMTWNTCNKSRGRKISDKCQKKNVVHPTHGKGVAMGQKAGFGLFFLLPMGFLRYIPFFDP